MRGIGGKTLFCLWGLISMVNNLVPTFWDLTDDIKPLTPTDYDYFIVQNDLLR